MPEERERTTVEKIGLGFGYYMLGVGGVVTAVGLAPFSAPLIAGGLSISTVGMNVVKSIEDE